MCLVTELDELGKFVHPFPRDGFAARIVLPQFLYRWQSCARKPVTAHTDLKWWHNTGDRSLCTRVAVHAIDLKIGDMKAVIERDWLDRATRRIVVIFDRLPLGRNGILALCPGSLYWALASSALLTIGVDSLNRIIM